MIKYRKRRKRGGILKKLEERIRELEERVDYLENIIQDTRSKRVNHLENIIEDTKGKNIVKNINKPIVEKETMEPQKPSQKSDKNIIPKNTNHKKIKEAIVGKYLIGALGPILIFIGAISFISLVWDSLSPGIKLGILALSGIALTALGFTLIRKKKNPVNSIILGTGAGLLFISILSSNMYFNFIGSTTAIILVGIWSGLFILSYKYTQVFFTSIIAYIGAYIAINLGLGLIVRGVDYIVLSLFATGISALMISTSRKWTSHSKQTLSVALSLLSYSTLLLWGLSSKPSLDMGFFKNYRSLFTLILAIIYFLLNYMYKLIDKDKKRLWYLIVGALATFLVTILTVLYTDIPFSFLIHKEMAYLFFITINLIQLIFIESKFKRIVNPLSKYYVITISFATLALNVQMLDSFIGLIFVAIMLLVIEKIMKHNNYSKIIPIMLAIDLILLLIAHYVSNGIFILYGLLQICVASYILYERYVANKTTDLFKLKTICLFIYMVNSSIVPYNIIYRLSGNMSSIVKYLGSAVMIIVLNTIGFFKEWDTEDFKIFSRNENIPDDNTRFLFYLITTVLYIQGIGLISSDSYYKQLIVIATTLAITLIETVSILKYYRQSNWGGFWIGLKYWILIWSSLINLFNLDVNSVVMSVVGLIIALGSIAIGFKQKAKSLRLYGLMLTILMVLKFIIIDLSQENSITRIIALIIGGLICFGISVLYNKLNNMIEE